MSKKPISFGKISLNLSKPAENDPKDEQTSGFGTFGRTPIQEHKEIEEIADDLENQHVHQVMGIKNFGKKAKSFNVEEMIEQAKKTASEAYKKRLESQMAAKASESQRESEENIMGPPPPPGDAKNGDKDTDPNTEDDDLIGPPLPPELVADSDNLIVPPAPPEKTKKVKDDDDSDEDSNDELSGSDDEDLTLEKRIPNTHEVSYYNSRFKMRNSEGLRVKT